MLVNKIEKSKVKWPKNLELPYQLSIYFLKIGTRYKQKANGGKTDKSVEGAMHTKLENKTLN